MPTQRQTKKLLDSKNGQKTGLINVKMDKHTLTQNDSIITTDIKW